MNKKYKKEDFKTPEGYFEGLTDKLLDKLSEEETAVFPKKDGFKVPEGYFDTLNQNIKKKLNAEETKVINLRSYKKFYYVAASIAAVALVIFGMNWNSSGSLTFDDLASSDIESYFESNEIDLSTYEIAEVLPVEELEINDILEDQFEEENIIDYLDDTYDDFDDLNLDTDEYEP